MTEIAIETRELGKRYQLGLHQRGYGTLRESLARAAPRLWHGLRGRRAGVRGGGRDGQAATLWALRDLSLTIRTGEVVGLIGHNGAGKSTLLKILSRITEPSAGWAEITGRVGSLLEVGTGFHPELTGRENIFLNGAILGMGRTEIRRRFDEIVEFAEIQRFLDTPVKRYSSGMSVRLAFAVAAHLEPEILLVDEVLAVGDAAFQRRSLGKMNEVASEGRTVIFVSHNLAIIQALCRRGVLMERGHAVADAPVDAAIAQYLRGLETMATTNLLDRSDRDGRAWANTMIQAVDVESTARDAGHPIALGRGVCIRVTMTEVLPAMECRLTISNSLGQPVTTLDSEISAPTDARVPAGSDGPGLIECEIDPLVLLPGRYRVDVLVKARSQIQDGLLGAAFFDVESGVLEARPIPASGLDGDVALAHSWRLPD